MEIMTVKEVAKYLRFNPITIYKMVKEGEIPALRYRDKKFNLIRFTKESINFWLDQKKNTIREVLNGK